MCNRAAIRYPEKVHLWTREMLEWEWLELVAYYNAAPTDALPVVRRDAEGRPRGTLAKWGVRFSPDGRPYMNAKKELAFTRWKEDVQLRRCVFVVDAFFEWPPNPPKTPWLYTRKGDQPFGLAGIYRAGATPAEDTFAILTTEPGALTSAIGHTRSPVILDEANVRTWAKPGPISRSEFDAITQPYPADKMERQRVTRRMNSSAFKNPESVRPLSAEEIAAEAGATEILGVERESGEQLTMW